VSPRLVLHTVLSYYSIVGEECYTATMAPPLRAGHDYHLPDAEVIQEMEKLESARSQSDREKKVNWLCETLTNEAEGAWPVDGDINGSPPVADTAKLATALEKLFFKGRSFYNIYQAEQFLAKFSSPRGFHSKSRGWNLSCAYTSEDRTKDYSSYPQVSPSRKRKKMEPISARVACPFTIAFTGDTWEKGKSKRWRTPVKVGKVVSQHTCDPGPESQAVAKNASGYYTKNMTDEAYDRLIVLLEAGGTNCNTIHQIMRHHIPEGISITSTDVHNMRARALKIRLEGRTLSTDEKRNFVSNPGLDFTETAFLLNGDIAITRAKKFLREILQELGDIWKVQAFFMKLKAIDPLFEYKIMRDEDQAPIGVVWTTKTMREAFVRFGDFVSFDMMKRHLNELHWSYCGLCGYDEDWRVANFVEGLLIAESYDTYEFEMKFLLSVETRRRKESIRVLFADCFLKVDFLTRVGLTTETTYVIMGSLAFGPSNLARFTSKYFRPLTAG
jgi:hypothetical protein